MACWGELGGSSRESLVHILEVALSAHTTPREIQQELLALNEYMGRHDYQLPISIRMQGDVATRCQAFAKALHYREMEYRAHSSISPRLVETLVSLHNSLQQVSRLLFWKWHGWAVGGGSDASLIAKGALVSQPEAALGVLHTAQELHGLQVKLSWLEKLGRWEEALQAYEQEHARSRRQERRSLHMGEARAGARSPSQCLLSVVLSSYFS